MVLSIIFISVVFVCERRRSNGCCRLHNLKVCCLVLCRSTQKKSIIVHRKIFNLLCRSCLDALNIIILFFSNFFVLSLHKSWNQKNLFCDSNVSQPYL